MLEILKQKILSWDPETANQFHGNIVRHAFDAGRVWELTSTGYFLYSPNRAEKRDYNGVRFELLHGDFIDQLNFKKALSDLMDTKAGTKLEKPTLVIAADIYGVPYTYSRQVNPVQSRGIPATNLKDVKAPTDAVYVALTKEIIKCAEDLVLAIDELNGNTTELLYPERLQFDWFCLDTESNTFFLSGNMNFSISREAFIDLVKGWANNASTIVSELTGQPSTATAQLTDYMNTQCTIYQPQ